MSECTCRCYLAIDSARDVWEVARDIERAWEEGDREGVRGGLERLWSACEALYAVRPGMMIALQKMSQLIETAAIAITDPDRLTARNDDPVEVANEAFTTMLDVAEKEVYLVVKADCER